MEEKAKVEYLLRNKSILLISPESWDHIHVSKHHYAIHLAKRGNRVFFLNPPSEGNSLVSSKIENLSIVEYQGFINGFRFLPKLLREKLTLKKFKEIEKQASVRMDVVWSFDNSAFYDFDALPKNVFKISHIVDLNMDYQTEKAVSTSNVCFFSTEVIGKKIRKFTDNAFFIDHGYSVPEISKKDNFLVNSSLAIGYAGNLDIKYFDWNLIETAVNQYKNLHFYFAGSCNNKKRKEWMDKVKNVHFVGILKKDELFNFLNSMNVLIITYLADSFRDQLANPHKLMEYFGTGKPVVATFTQEYDGLDLLYMSQTNGEWLKVFRHVFENLEACSSNDLVHRRKKYAIDNTYDNQIDRIEKIIASLAKLA